MDVRKTDESPMVIWAREELVRIGQYEEDPEFADSLVAAVAAFTSYGHSGGSAGCGVAMLGRLLLYRPLAPLTSDPEEWMDITDNPPTWQSRRNGACFSNDGGRTYYDIDEPLPRWRRVVRGIARRLGWSRRWEPRHRTVDQP